MNGVSKLSKEDMSHNLHYIMRSGNEIMHVSSTSFPESSLYLEKLSQGRERTLGTRLMSVFRRMTSFG